MHDPTPDQLNWVFFFKDPRWFQCVGRPEKHQSTRLNSDFPFYTSMSFETHILPLIICVLFSFPGGSEVKASASNAGDLVFDPWVGKIPWGRKWQSTPVKIPWGRKWQSTPVKIPWWRKWQPTPVFLPGESQGQRSLVGYSPQRRRVRHDWATSLSFFLSLFL